MKYLFTSWDILLSEIRTASHRLVLSDYDGTLTPIVRRPEEALLSPVVKEKIISLAKKPAFTFGIISGRTLSNLKTLVGMEGIYYAGNHGLEIDGPHFYFINPAAREAKSGMRVLFNQLRSKLNDIQGIIVENKELSLSVHYRLVKQEDKERAAKIFWQITTPLIEQDKIRITAGKKVWDIMPPVDWNKGEAVEMLIKKFKAETGNLLTLYLGDDTTDEDAFRVVRRPAGWGVFVGEEKTLSSAEYYLKSSSEVSSLLCRLSRLGLRF